MTYVTPKPAEVAAVLDELGISADAADVAEYHTLTLATGALYRLLDRLPDEAPPVRFPRTPGRLPGIAENPHNAWQVLTDIPGAAGGKLAGKTVAVKDNVMLAGVPMLAGNGAYEGFIPGIDATVVTRILDAGGRIVGKTHCETASGGGHTNPTGLIHNPHKRGYSPGGTSGGSAVVVAAGAADMAIGADQGGSIRIPAAHCGIVGLKPTWGLVPYTGIAPFEYTIDHAGPMTRDVADNALLLDVIAGPDGWDPRQGGAVKTDYLARLDGSPNGLRVALLDEGFAGRNADERVDAKVRAAAASLEALGVIVERVSIPDHRLADGIAGAILTQSVSHAVLRGDAYGVGHQGYYALDFMKAHRDSASRIDMLSENTKLLLVTARLLERRYGLTYFAKANNILCRLRRDYDAVLARYDALLMPTIPFPARPMPKPGTPRPDIISFAFNGVGDNTAAFNHTHHPALSAPCGLADELPIGMMLVGAHFNEGVLYQIAHAFERQQRWQDR